MKSFHIILQGKVIVISRVLLCYLDKNGYLFDINLTWTLIDRITEIDLCSAEIIVRFSFRWTRS